MKRQAEITVFLSLIFASLCALICVVIKSSKYISMNMQTDALTETAFKSALNEYCVPLYDNYGLVFVDTSYGGGYGGDDAFASHIENYIAECLHLDESDDMYDLEINYVNVIEAEYAIDDSMKPIIKQINEYENSKGVYGNDYILLDSYLYSTVLPMEELKIDDEKLEAMSYDEKLGFICESIERNITNTTNRAFSFSNCLSKAEVCAGFRGTENYSKVVYKR